MESPLVFFFFSLLVEDVIDDDEAVTTVRLTPAATVLLHTCRNT